MDVPQGSFLAPVLFLLLINDITEGNNNAVCSFYADDVVIYVTGENIHNVTINLQNTVNVLNSWYNRKRLKINISKTKTMLITTKSSVCLNIYIDHELIEQVHSCKPKMKCIGDLPISRPSKVLVYRRTVHGLR